ncbi:hypothetical protein [Chryseobacterium proteolyticum]
MYTEAKKDGIISTWLLIEYLVFERKAITFLMEWTSLVTSLKKGSETK